MIKAMLKTFGRRHIDVSLRSGTEFIVRIMEYPGRWMTQAQLDALADDLRQVASTTLAGGTLDYGVFSGERAAFETIIITLVCRRDKTPIAFSALAVMKVETIPRPTEVMHLGLVMVDPVERSKNLSWVLYGLTCFLVFFRRQLRPVWISNVTQVPAVVGMVSQMFSNVWPQPNGHRRTLNHLLLARRIMESHRHVFGVGQDAEFDEERFVIANAYTGGSDDLKKTWEMAPKHRDEQFNDFCADILNYERGDDVIQLGRMDIAAMRSFLSREVPRSAVLGLLGAAGLIALQRLILPAVYWADSRKEWSILRPAAEGKTDE